MRIQHFLAFAMSAVVSLSACADPSITPAANPAASVVTVQAGALGHYRLAPDDAMHMRGAFQLDDGRVLTVSNQRGTLFAELDGKREELLPMGPERFVMRDSGARVTFDRVPFAMEVSINQAAR